MTNEDKSKATAKTKSASKAAANKDAAPKSKSAGDAVAVKAKSVKTQSKPSSSKVMSQSEKSKPPVNEQINMQTKSSGKGLSVFAIFLSLAALGGTGFTWYQTQVQSVQATSKIAVGVTEIGSQVTRLSDFMVGIQKQQDANITSQELASQMQSASIETDKKHQLLGQQQQKLADTVSEINNELTKGTQAYIVQEVSQLLKLANYNINFTGDIQSAVAALKLADGQLKELDDPRYAVVSKQISKELVDLANVQLPDVQVMSASLTSISERIPSLPLENEPKTKTKPLNQVSVVGDTGSAGESTTQATKEKATFRHELRQLWSDIFDNAISIQRVDQPPKPLLAPEQRYFLNQNIQLSLASAQLALLQKQSSLYQQHIQTATKWLNEYFDPNNSQVVNVLSQLKNLHDQKIEVELPSITGSYDELVSIKGGK